MVLVSNPMEFFTNHPHSFFMVKFSTKLSFDVKLESMLVKETTRTISKVLKATKETIRTRLRKRT